jgi:hypothetical protein
MGLGKFCASADFNFARDFHIPVCTKNSIRVDDVMESPKLAE